MACAALSTVNPFSCNECFERHPIRQSLVIPESRNAEGAQGGAPGDGLWKRATVE